jgi:hypothetical protein
MFAKNRRASKGTGVFDFFCYVVFTCFHIVAKSAYERRHVRPSVHLPARIKAAPTERTSARFDSDDFCENRYIKSKFG